MNIFSANTSVNFLDIPFDMKDKFKRILLWDSENKSWKTRRFSALSIKWDNDNNKWYDETDEKPIDIINQYRRIYLNVPFDDKDFVKTNGGRWDGNKKKWHTIASNEALQKYMPEDHLYNELKSYFYCDNIKITELKN